jgi:hypothetical protein
MFNKQETRISFSQEIRCFLLRTSMLVVIVGFVFLVAVNLSTFLHGPSRILESLRANSLGIVFTPFVFDSWGTISGLLGVTIFFAPLFLGTRSQERRSLALFFLFASVGIGIISALLWNYAFNSSGTIPYGSSSIDISAQAIIFTLSVSALVGLRQKSNLEKYARNSFAIIYATLIVTTLWFVLLLEPIFIPSNLYNWKVHETAFIIGVLTTIIYIVIRSCASLNTRN